MPREKCEYCKTEHGNQYICKNHPLKNPSVVERLIMRGFPIEFKVIKGGHTIIKGEHTNKVWNYVSSCFQRIVIPPFSLVWWKYLYDYHTDKQSRVIRVRGWRSALIETPNKTRISVTFCPFYFW